MTKAVRIENADTSDHELVVEVWEAETLVEKRFLKNPADMVSLLVWTGRVIKVYEKRDGS